MKVNFYTGAEQVLNCEFAPLQGNRVELAVREGPHRLFIGLDWIPACAGMAVNLFTGAEQVLNCEIAPVRGNRVESAMRDGPHRLFISLDWIPAFAGMTVGKCEWEGRWASASGHDGIPPVNPAI